LIMKRNCYKISTKNGIDSLKELLAIKILRVLSEYR
jgi:hypothetical protein